MRLDRHRLHNRKLVDTRLESLCFVFSLSPPLRTLRCLASWALRPAASRAMQARGTIRTVRLRGKGCGGGACFDTKGVLDVSKEDVSHLKPQPPTSTSTSKKKTQNQPPKTNQNRLRPLLEDRRLARRGVPNLLGRSIGGAHKGAHRTVSWQRFGFCFSVVFYGGIIFFHAFFCSLEPRVAAFFSPSPFLTRTLVLALFPLSLPKLPHFARDFSRSTSCLFPWSIPHLLWRIP